MLWIYISNAHLALSSLFTVPFIFPEGDLQILFTNDFFRPAIDKTQSYIHAILRLPIAFYYNALTGIILTGNLVKQRCFPGSVLSHSNLPDVRMLRRPTHDSFRPPNGPSVKYLTSIGYGNNQAN